MIKQKLYIYPMVLGGYYYETEDLDSWIKYEDIQDSIDAFRASLVSRVATNDMVGIVEEFDSFFS